MITVYGISNCDTVKKAKRWLEQQAIEYQFHDFRKQGLDAATLEKWAKLQGWESLLNKRSTSWKQLDPSSKETLNESTALELMLQNPTLIKRPVLDLGKEVHNGFNDTQYSEIFARHKL